MSFVRTQARAIQWTISVSGQEFLIVIFNDYYSIGRVDLTEVTIIDILIN